MAKVLWVQNIWVEYMGVMSISAQLKRCGHESEIIFGKKEEVAEYIKNSQPCTIAFSLMSVQWSWAKEVTSFLKENGIKVPIFVGGVHPSLFPSETMSHHGIDVCCLGEGEYPMLEFLEAIEEDKDYSHIPNLWVRKNGAVLKNATRPKMCSWEVDDLDHADRNIYKKYEYFRKYPFELFLGSRGCPFKCAFCEIPLLNEMYGGKKVVYRDPIKFVDEIAAVKDRGALGDKLIMFSDSTFNSNKTWFLRFLREYRQRVNLPFTCNIRADLFDEEQAEDLALSNCDTVRFGVESGDSDIRNRLFNKHLTDGQIMNVSQLLDRHKIKFVTFNVFGNPEETLEQAWMTVHMNQTIKPHAMGSYILMLYPKLKVTDYALTKGLIDEKAIYEKLGLHPYNIYMSILQQKDINEVCNLHKFSILLVRYPFLEPVVRRLINLPPNELFNLIYSISQAFEWRKWISKSSIFSLIYEGILNYQALARANTSSKSILSAFSVLIQRKVSEKGSEKGCHQDN